MCAFQQPKPDLTDSMILHMLAESEAAERQAASDALSMDLTPQQVYDLEIAVRCETIRSYLYQAGILSDTPLQRLVSEPPPARTPDSKTQP